jgi:hypothetical protein
MTTRFTHNSHSKPRERWPGYAAISCLLFGVLRLSALVHAGSIFDDNWTPPKPVKPATAPSATHPTPEPAAPAAPSTPAQPPPPVTPPPAVASNGRRPIPGAAEQVRSRKLFKDAYAVELAEHAPAARRALANKLLAQAGQLKDAPADQFVLLVGASEAAKELKARLASGAREARGIHILSARWGGGNNWADVTERLNELLSTNARIWANPHTLGADPTPGWRKHLEVTFMRDGKKQSKHIDEDQEVHGTDFEP